MLNVRVCFVPEKVYVCVSCMNRWMEASMSPYRGADKELEDLRSRFEGLRIRDSRQRDDLC